VTTILSSARAGYGVIQLGLPVCSAEQLLGGPLDQWASLAVRLLGARQLSQAVLSGAAPSKAVLALGVEVDTLHALSMAALAAGDRRWRRAAGASALSAAAFALGGVVATRHANPSSPCHAPQSGLAYLRERWAQQLAHRLIPRLARRILLLAE
jgi:hypothetical protein